MRHSRRAVMTERYKIYMRKHIFNGKYFVRNLQIAICSIAAIALVVGLTVVAFSAKSEDKDKSTVAESTEVSVKEALFGISEEENTVVKDTEQVTTSTERASTEKVFAELTTTENVKAKEPKKEEKTVKSEFDGKCIANVDETLNIRKEPSAEAEFVGQMNSGAIAIVEGSEGEWTKIKSGDVSGYVLTEYVLTGQSAEEMAANHVTLLGTVLEDGVNIRTEKSTDAEILTVMNKNDTVTVLEKPEEEETEENAVVAVFAEDSVDVESSTENITESTTENVTTEAETTTEITTENVTTEVKQEEVTASEEKTEEIAWVSVMLEDGKIGYVSADFIEVDELYEIAVSAEELARREAEAAEEAARKAAEEEAARQAAAAAAAQNQNNNDDYQGATTTPVTTTESGDLIGTFTVTAYCGCKKCCGGNGKRTASGTVPTEGRTIAADTSILPFGTQVVIDGIVYTVEDKGSGVKGNHIDIFFATHKKALAFGKKTIKVYKY